MNSFYSQDELKQLGIKKYGNNVLISKKCSIYGAENIEIGDNVRIDDFCILSGKITLGNYIHVAAYSALYGSESGIVIEDYANISSRVTIYSISDDYSGRSMTNPMIEEQYKRVISAPVKIERHVIVGATSVIMPGVTLREGSAFGAFSFVNYDSIPWTVYAGIPSKPIHVRDKRLLEYEREFETSLCRRENRNRRNDAIKGE